MIQAWLLPQLGRDTRGVLSAAVAGNVSSLTTPRQFFPDVSLDVPTLMALVVVFTFLIQFYFTVVSLNLAAVASASSLSLSSATTTTTTAATAILAEEETLFTLRTQTVTPAPAPEWRFHSHRQERRSLDSRSKNRRAVQLLSSQPWDTPHHLNQARRSFGRPQAAPREAMPRQGRTAGGRHTWPRRMSLLYEAKDDGPSGEVPGMLDPLTLSSHRVSVLPENTKTTKTNAVELVSSVLYGAERWGDRLQEWNILSPDGAQALTQTLLMIRCAFISPDFCAKLDHYFRRQHDLNLVAAMMNDYDNHTMWQVGTEQLGTPMPKGTEPKERQAETERDKEVVLLGKFGRLVRLDKGGGRTSSPGELEAQSKIGAVGLVDHHETSKRPSSLLGGVKRPETLRLSSIIRPKGSPAERQGKWRLAGVGSSGAEPASGKTWGLYIVVTLACVVLLVMEAAHRILQLVARPGRALHYPHQDTLETLTAALHRWHESSNP